MELTIRPRLQVITFGDSITQFAYEHDGGFGFLLQKYFLYKADIINRGMSGYTTDLALKLVPYIFDPSNEQTLAVIMFGANDAAEAPSTQHVPLERYKDNIKKIVKVIRDNRPNADLILMTPTPMIKSLWDKEAFSRFKSPGYRSGELARRYASEVVTVSEELGIPCVNFWKDSNVWSGEDMFIDGLHLSNKGYSVLFESLKNVIENQLPHLSFEKLPAPFPHYIDVFTNYSLDN
ncbi:GDSL esterase/lipase [Acrasis kona]|uniref:GDSL esterase/lipase n=1 Tax=Acrasis kona TaxID=1008807 RepID=A0AAW2ZBS1_9EUKA